MPPSTMPRNLVLCLDGTSNQYSATNTNVVKLYAMLDRADGQLAYYQPGIGTSVPTGIWGRIKRWVIKQIDLAIACAEHLGIAVTSALVVNLVTEHMRAREASRPALRRTGIAPSCAVAAEITRRGAGNAAKGRRE